VVVMKRARKILTIMIMLSILAPAMAEVLVSVDCPESVYQYELFTCTVTLYNDSTTDTGVDYVVHFDRSRAQPLEYEKEGDVNIPALTKKVLEFNVWAKSTGRDAFVFEYGHGRIDSLAAKAFYVSSTPLRLDLDKISLTAGQKNTIKTHVEGTGSFVYITFDYPPGIIGTQRVDLGDVEDEKPVTIEMSPDPYIVGTKTIEAHVFFMDDKGNHVLLQKIEASISPSMNFIVAAIAVVVVLALAAFVMRRKMSGESGS